MQTTAYNQYSRETIEVQPFAYLHKALDYFEVKKAIEEAYNRQIAFSGGDWSNPEYVEQARQSRIEYHNRNESGTARLVSEMQNQGYTNEEIARAVSEYRNQSRLSAYVDSAGNIIDKEGYEQAISHIKTYEDLIREGKTDIDIIQSATRGNPGMDACTGLHDEYYNTYSGEK